MEHTPAPEMVSKERVSGGLLCHHMSLDVTPPHVTCVRFFSSILGIRPSQDTDEDSCASFLSCGSMPGDEVRS